jgi:hypothetical protein
MRNIPQYIDNVLDEWETLAFLAYDWYEKAGRLVVGIEEDENNPSGAKMMGILYDFKAGKPDPTTARLLSEYDPDTEILIQFMDKKGDIRTQRVRTGPNARHPKRVYFFEMLRRIDEAPETIDPQNPPDWFVDVLESLETADHTK